MTFHRITTLIIFYCLCCPLLSCKNYHRNKTYAGVSSESIEKGEALARQYCQSCHLFPEPSTLDAKTWDEGVLPAMGPMLGIFSHNFQRYPSAKNDRNLDTNFYPKSSPIGPMQWQHIIDYYTATSPDSIALQVRKAPIKTNLPFFKVQLLKNFNLKTITYLKVVSPGQLLVADKETQSLVKLDNRFNVIDSVPSAGTIADIDFTDGKMLLCDMGQINPTNGRFGLGRYSSIDPGGKMHLDSLPFLKGLARPVQIVSADLNKDGMMDYLVCEFGFMMGDLSWYHNRGNDSFQRKVIASFVFNAKGGKGGNAKGAK